MQSYSLRKMNLLRFNEVLWKRLFVGRNAAASYVIPWLAAIMACSMTMAQLSWRQYQIGISEFRHDPLVMALRLGTAWVSKICFESFKEELNHRLSPLMPWCDTIMLEVPHVWAIYVDGLDVASVALDINELLKLSGCCQYHHASGIGALGPQYKLWPGGLNFFWKYCHWTWTVLRDG